MKMNLPYKSGKVTLTSHFGWRTLNGQRDYHKGVDLSGTDKTLVAPCDAGDDEPRRRRGRRHGRGGDEHRGAGLRRSVSTRAILPASRGGAGHTGPARLPGEPRLWGR